MKYGFPKYFIIAAACVGLMTSCGGSSNAQDGSSEEIKEETSEVILGENPPTKNVISSPPEVVSDTVDMTTFPAGEKWRWSCFIRNTSSNILLLDSVVSSDPHIICKVRSDTVPERGGVGVWVYANFDKPVGRYKVKTEIYWKNYKNPTVIYFKGNCVEKE